MTVKSKLAFVLVATVLSAPALAQQPGKTGAAAVVSEPGKATAVRTVEVSAQVVGIDKATRTLTLKGAKGEVVDVVASDEVKRFDEIKVGDSIVARYIEALTLELKKTRVAAGDVKVSQESARSKPGEQPAGLGARQVIAIADVVAVDPAKSTITIKGPSGNLTHAQRAEPGSVQGRQEGRPDRGDLHPGAGAEPRAGVAGSGQEVVAGVVSARAAGPERSAAVSTHGCRTRGRLRTAARQRTASGRGAWADMPAPSGRAWRSIESHGNQMGSNAVQRAGSAGRRIQAWDRADDDAERARADRTRQAPPRCASTWSPASPPRRWCCPRPWPTPPWPACRWRWGCTPRWCRW